MKKLIKNIIVYILVLSLVGCGKSYQEAISDSGIQKDGECGGYFTELISWESGFYKIVIVYANDTKVKYFMRNGGNGWGITPLYNADGSLQIYEGE